MTTTMSTPEPSVVLDDGSLARRPASRSGLDLRGLRAALTAEWIKLTSVRSTKAILALAIGGGLLVTWAVARFVTDEVLYVVEVGFYWTSLTAILASVAGILLFTSEVQHGTLGVTLTIRPSRWTLALSKTVVAAAAGLVLGGVGMTAGFAGAALGGIPFGDSSGLAATVGWALLYPMLAAVLGLGIGMIVRHGAAAVAGLLIWGLVIEGLLQMFLPATIWRSFPFLAGDRLLGLESDLVAPEAFAVMFSRPLSAAVLLTYAAFVVLVGAFLLHRRDVG